MEQNNATNMNENQEVNKEVLEGTLFDILMQLELRLSTDLDFNLERLEVATELNEMGALYNQNCFNYIMSDEGLKQDWPVAIQEMAFLAGAVAIYHQTKEPQELMKRGILQMYIGEYKNIYAIDKHFQKIYEVEDQSMEAMRVQYTILSGTMCNQISQMVQNKNIPSIQVAIPDLMMACFHFGVNYGKSLLNK